MKPISIKTIAADLALSHADDLLISGFAIDSRNIKPGDLFFALPGTRVHGENFLAEAAQKKAAAAIVSADYKGPTYGMRLLYVPDVLLALQELARKKVARYKGKIVAITGSMGKTTTKEFAKTLLEKNYILHASPLSYNSQRTLPLTILEAEEHTELLLLEMGMSEPGEMANLVSIAPPTLALITTLALQHANHFPEGLDAIAHEKGQIFSHPHTKEALFPKELPSLSSYARCRTRTFSVTNPEADFFFQREELESFSSEAHRYNFVAAASLALCLQVPREEIKRRIPFLKAPPLRFQRIERAGITFINDAYNANPTAFISALADLPPCQGKKIGVVSEMDALGRFSKEGHKRVSDAAYTHLDHLLCIGNGWKECASYWKNKPFEWFSDRDQLFARAKELGRAGDLIFLKGARSYRLEETLSLFLS